MNRQTLKTILEAYRARIKPKSVLRDSKSRFKEVERAVKNFNPHGEQGRIAMPRGGKGGFRWGGKDLRSSPGASHSMSIRKGFTDDVYDVAAVAAHRKPAASVSFSSSGTDFAAKKNQNLRHFSRKAKAKGATMSPVGSGASLYPGSFTIGKRKNVHKLMRMHKAQEQHAHGRKILRGKSRPKKASRVTFDTQVGAALGYPRDKVQAFIGRSTTRFSKFHKGEAKQRRADVVSLPKAKYTKRGKLAVPRGKLPEDRQALIDAILEATIDYVMTNVKGGRSAGPAWIRYQNREVTEELSDDLKAKLKRHPAKPKYKGNVRSRSELMSKIGKMSVDRFGHETLHLPGHKVFLTRFKKPKRLPENIGD